MEEKYEVDATVDFIITRHFTRVALQFPDELLKDSTRVVSLIKSKLRIVTNEQNQQQQQQKEDDGVEEVRLFVMADTTYGSCCVDEVAASHVAAHCVVHYGHTCLSPTSTLPAFFVFGRAHVDVRGCLEALLGCRSSSGKPIMVLFGLEYAHAIPRIREQLVANGSNSNFEFHVADTMGSIMDPPKNESKPDGLSTPAESSSNDCLSETSSSRYKIGGLTWDLPEGCKMEDYLLFWIGPDNSAFANVVMTFNNCEIVRYDALGNHIVTDVSQQRRILKRRYYLVEKAKDANIVGILVGTLGVAGYLNMIHQMKDLITSVGKKSYTFIMGRPNPAKLANFPECDVFIYVSCAQTGLLDSKEFLAPVITPFEATLAFTRGSEWTGAYLMEFRDLMNSSPVVERKHSEEARFSFLQGSYVEDLDLQETNEKENDGALSLVNATEKALKLRDSNSTSLVNGTVKSGAEFFATRSYHGLDVSHDGTVAEPYLIGRTGKASGYQHEKEKQAG